MRQTNQSTGGRYEPLESRLLLTRTAPGWTALSALPAARGVSSDLNLEAFKPYAIDTATVAGTLAGASPENVAEYGVGRGAAAVLVGVPTPDGGYQRFRVVESSILSADDAAKYSDIKTYAGVGVDDPSASIRLDVTPLGFHAQVLTPTGEGTYYVDPYYRGSQSVYASYYASQAKAPKGFTAAADDIAAGVASQIVPAPDADGAAARTSGTQLRTYRTAVATTGEYTEFFGDTQSAGLSAVVTAMNRVDGVYESELSIRLTLVSGESNLIFTNPDTDPYTNDDPGSLLDENQQTIDDTIGSNNYDLGHVFSTAGGGLAGLGVVGQSDRKAEGETGTDSPVGDAFTIDYVAHEMGHQFGANHTFNTATDSNRNADTAYEPGSATTIMGYAGITGDNSDLALHSDPYFAFVSLDEILAYVDGDVPGVGTRTATGNHIPTVSGGANYSIPANTPFALTASGFDSDGDAVYYSWEEADLGPATTLNQADNGSSPLFRVYNPTTSPTRSFPQLASVLSGLNATAAPYGGLAERLPTTARTMKFVITARDKRSGGGGTNVLSASPTRITSVPFTVGGVVTGFGVTNFNSATTVAGGSSQTLSWQVANTTASPIGTANVAILMSTDGGQTFPITLAASTPNDGSQAVAMPYNTGSSQVRFKIAAVGNVFYDINNASLTITSVPPSTGNNASIKGVTFDDKNANGVFDTGDVATSGKTVFLDTDNDGVLDSTEARTTTASNGSYSFTGLAAGTYHVRRVFATGYTLSTPTIDLTLASGQAVTGQNIGSKPAGSPTTGSLSGFAFDDANKNGTYDTGETKTSGKTVFLDADNDGVLDSGEKSVTTSTGGTFAFTGLAAGTYHVRRVFATGYTLSTPKIDVTLSAGQSVSNLTIGSKAGSATTTGSIAGFAFDDKNKNGTYDTGDALSVGKTIYLDLDDDGVKDAGEPSVVTDSAGKFSFAGLTARTYHVRRVFATGYAESTPARNISLTGGQNVTGVSIGSKAK